MKVIEIACFPSLKLGREVNKLYCCNIMQQIYFTSDKEVIEVKRDENRLPKGLLLALLFNYLFG